MKLKIDLLVPAENTTTKPDSTIIGTDTTAPRLGRFLTQDPIGFAGGMNLYGYVGNNPVNFIDSLGLCAEPVSIWEDPVFGVTSSIMLGTRAVFAGLSAGERAVLYYGKDAWKLAAASEGIPIFKTAIGNIMNKFENIGIKLPRIVWDAASAIYAAGARGTVQVFRHCRNIVRIIVVLFTE